MDSKLKVLVVDDEMNIVNVISAYLQAEGHEVITAYDGVAGLDAFYRTQPDFVILDLMMPELSGENVCREIRESSDVPIIMLTAKVAEKDKIAGLDLGADDYVSKPFSPGELMARVRAVARRRISAKSKSVSIYEDGYLNVDEKRKLVIAGGEQLKLTMTEFELLCLLCKSVGRTFTRDELIASVLGYDYDGYDRTIDVHIKNLRKKLIRPYIETVYGLGYRFKGAEDHEKNVN